MSVFWINEEKKSGTCALFARFEHAAAATAWGGENRGDEVHQVRRWLTAIIDVYGEPNTKQ